MSTISRPGLEPTITPGFDTPTTRLQVPVPETRPVIRLGDTPRAVPRTQHWVWALAGGGPYGAFQAGAIACVSRDRAFWPEGIASTSVGSINLLGAAERSRTGFEKVTRAWCEVRNLRDMYVPAPWLDALDSLEFIQRVLGLSLRRALEGTGPRNLRSVAAGDPVGDLVGFVADLPGSAMLGGISVALGPIRQFLGPAAGFLGWFLGREVNIDVIRRDLPEALRILQTRADGLWVFSALHALLSRYVDMTAIGNSRTSFRICWVNLSDGVTHAVDQEFRLIRYTFDQTRTRAERQIVGALTQARPIEGITAGILPARTDVFLHAVLASSSIPMANPPVQLGGRTLDACVDGGVRDGLPVDQAIDILQTELASSEGRKGVIAIGTGVPNPQTTRPLLGELAPPPFSLEGSYQILKILFRARDIVIDEVAAAEIRDVFRLADRGLDSISIVPAFDFGAGAALIDPGVVQINMAYGWMTAYDRLRQHREGLSDERYRLLWVYTNLIAQLRYRAWLLEREGAFFKGEYPLLFSGLLGVLPLPFPLGPNAGIAGEVLHNMLWSAVPFDWVFREAVPGETSVIRTIRILKAAISTVVSLRLRDFGLDSLPTVHDLSNFSVGNVNTVADWFLDWERHAVQQDTNRPTGPGLLDETGTADHFRRLSTPWQTQPYYTLRGSDAEPASDTFPLEVAFDAYPSTLDPATRSEAIATLRRLGARPRTVYGVRPLDIGFAQEPAAAAPTSPLLHENTVMVRLEGYVWSSPQPGTVELHQLARGVDTWLTSSADFAGWLNLGSQGFIFDPSLPAPLGTIPLITWESVSRVDHLTSADYSRFVEGDPLDRHAAWSAVEQIQPDYILRRIEGYVFPPGRPAPRGATPLVRWIDRSGQHFITRGPAPSEDLAWLTGAAPLEVEWGFFGP